MPVVTLRAAGRRVVRRIAGAPPLIVLAIAWLTLIVYAFPGQMTRDSFDHLREARGDVWTDGHPPAINLIWKLVDYLVAGPFGMLVLQSTLFLAGLFVVLRRVFAPRRAAWLAGAVFLFPPVMMPMAVIWKDCLMAGFLMLGLGALLSERRWVRVAGLAAMFAATAVRYNTLAATLPLVVLLFEWNRGTPWLRRYALAAAAWLALTFAAFSFNSALTDRQMHIWHSSLAVHDIVGTLAFLDEDLPDAELREQLAGTELLVDHDIHARIRAVYEPSNFLPIIGSPVQPLWRLPIDGFTPAPQAQRDALARAWWETIASHPGAYLRHRFAVLATVLSIGDSTPPGAITKREAPDWNVAAERLDLQQTWSGLQLRMTRWAVEVWKHTPLFVPLIYLVLSLLCLPLAFRQRDVLAILLSGLSFEGGLLFLAPSPDYRYSHWMVICTVVGLIVLTARRMRRGAQARPAANTQHAVASQASAQ